MTHGASHAALVVQRREKPIPLNVCFFFFISLKKGSCFHISLYHTVYIVLCVTVIVQIKELPSNIDLMDVRGT